MKIHIIDRVRTAFVLMLIAYCSVLSAQNTSRGAPAVNPDAKLVSDFEKEVDAYVKLHKKAAAGIPALKATDSAHEINEHRRLLAANIRTARSNAKPGDIFSPAITEEFTHLIAIAYQGADAARVRTSLKNDEPVQNLPVQVNAAYPENIPLQSTPPSLLLNLPNLPAELDYRIVGRTLVLRDTGANIIVDYIPNAIPSA